MSKRSYGQYCGLARSLDVLGGRWSLLVVRELLDGPARYNRLLEGLPGIATNLLAERLRELEQAGVVQRSLDADSNSVVYSLTPWGSELRGVVTGLVKWSTPLMISGPQSDTFQTHWLSVALSSLLDNKHTDEPRAVGLEVDGTLITVRTDKSGISIALDDDAQPETVLRAEPMVVLGLASGMLTAEQAIAAGEFRGNKKDLADALSPG
ncbi:winged helix-turn-helix transcriptional regulator [Nocardia sp. NBC_01327]|uniref:winged helix-turn-helix transcriptional regulator n=1 Tax=Nocardia sp. NBC_01327 TaxID=2903593 RepID=UPI002E129E97|nr:helix-turn-helix transcriptional regulator [Nocardia sp. NBC_01327]